MKAEDISEVLKSQGKNVSVEAIVALQEIEEYLLSKGSIIGIYDREEVVFIGPKNSVHDLVKEAKKYGKGKYFAYKLNTAESIFPPRSIN